MRTVKYLGIWLAGLLVITLLINVIGGVLCKFTAADILMPSLIGYSKKMQLPFNEEARKDSRQVGARLAVRSLLSDERLMIHPHFVFGGMYADTSIIFLNKDGLHDLSTGIFSPVYRDLGDEESKKLTSVFALIDVRALSEQDCAGQLSDVLASYPDAAVRVDAYTRNDCLITPAAMTVLDTAGNELLHVECPADGELTREDHCFVRTNLNENGETELYRMLQDAILGKRRSDKLAAELVPQLPFDQPTFEEQKLNYRFGALIVQQMEANDGYGMITVTEFNYAGEVLFYCLVFGGIFTVILLIVFIAKRPRD